MPRPLPSQGSPTLPVAQLHPQPAAQPGARLTSEDGEAPHGGERVVAGRVEDVQLVDLAADGVELAVEVLDRGRVGILEVAREEARHDGRLAHLGRTKDDHAVAVLGWYTELRVARAHLLDHRSQFHWAEGWRAGGCREERRAAGALRSWAGSGLGSGCCFCSRTESLWLSAPSASFMCSRWPLRPASVRHARHCLQRRLRAAAHSSPAAARKPSPILPGTR